MATRDQELPISNRAQQYLSQNYPLMEGMMKYLQNPYSTSNPTGIINLGTAENTLNINELNTKLEQSTALKLKESDVKYNGFVGTDSFRKSLARFLNHSYALDSNLIEFENISVHNGCGSVLELLGYTLCDPNDAIIIPSPYYSGFDKDLAQRPQAKLIQAPALNKDQKVDLKSIQLAYESYEFQHKIKAVLIMNPVNPTGEILDLETIESISDFCKSKNLHLIVDEIYAFTKLDSTLQFPTAWQLNQPHISLIWGFSKDFCVNGFRTGLLVTKNQQILKSFMELSYFYMVPTIVQNCLEQVVDDLDFCDEYFRQNDLKLNVNLKIVLNYLKQFSDCIEFIMPQGGFFIYINASKLLKSATKAFEYKLWIELIEQGVYFALGEAFHGPIGWFRICFAVDEQLLRMALDRMVLVFKRHQI